MPGKRHHHSKKNPAQANKWHAQFVTQRAKAVRISGQLRIPPQHQQNTPEQWCQLKTTKLTKHIHHHMHTIAWGNAVATLLTLDQKFRRENRYKPCWNPWSSGIIILKVPVTHSKPTPEILPTCGQSLASKLFGLNRWKPFTFTHP